MICDATSTTLPRRGGDAHVSKNFDEDGDQPFPIHLDQNPQGGRLHGRRAVLDGQAPDRSGQAFGLLQKRDQFHRHFPHRGAFVPMQGMERRLQSLLPARPRSSFRTASAEGSSGASLRLPSLSKKGQSPQPWPTGLRIDQHQADHVSRRRNQHPVLSDGQCEIPGRRLLLSLSHLITSSSEALCDPSKSTSRDTFSPAGPTFRRRAFDKSGQGHPNADHRPISDQVVARHWMRYSLE